jgi:hypothetical protein
MGLQDSPPRRKIVTADRNTPAKFKPPDTNGTFQGHHTAGTTTTFATRPAPPTQEELRQLGLQVEFSSDEYQEEPPPTEQKRNNGTWKRDTIWKVKDHAKNPIY